MHTHTFHTIAKKILNIENDNWCIFNNVHKINFYIFIQKAYSIENKFSLFCNVYVNIFYTKQLNEEFVDYFSKMQRTYHAFSRLAYIYKYKKAPIMVKTDLIMNEINEKDKLVYCLLQNDCKYLFNIHELIKIINNSIANSHCFFSTPTSIKNPYNNIILSKSTLYNIYFFIFFKTIKRPELFYYFFKSNFDVSIFVEHYQYLIRNFAIASSLNNCSKQIICENIDCMLQDYNLSVKHRKYQINIDVNFPKDVLIKIMKPYLSLFLKSQFSLITNERNYCKKLLQQKLYKFSKFNPVFGRRIILKKSAYLTNLSYNQIEYNNKHISFNNDDNDTQHKNFMSSHNAELLDDHDTEDDSDSDNDNVNNYRNVHHYSFTNNTLNTAVNSNNNINNIPVIDTLDLNFVLFDIISDTENMLDNADLDSVS
jgi:hypothetical protein